MMNASSAPGARRGLLATLGPQLVMALRCCMDTPRETRQRRAGATRFVAKLPTFISRVVERGVPRTVIERNVDGFPLYVAVAKEGPSQGAGRHDENAVTAICVGPENVSGHVPKRSPIDVGPRVDHVALRLSEHVGNDVHRIAMFADNQDPPSPATGCAAVFLAQDPLNTKSRSTRRPRYGGY